jgi:DNA-binding CsgD family transcriptional regulator
VPQSSSEHLFEEALNLLSIAIFVIGSDHKVIWMNRRGRSLVDSKNGILMTNGRLRGETPTQTREIDEVLARTTARQPLANRERLVLARPVARRSGSQPLRLVAMAVPDADPAKPSQDPFSILYIGDDESHRVSHPELLRALFGLTPTEARIAAEVANGLSLKEVAGELRLGTGTVRWHAKRIMSRTETSRQAQLVRMILLSPLGFLAI